jgi:hypothetical protein
MFRRKNQFDRRMTKMGKRVSKIPSADLPEWADMAINDAGRALTNWRRRGDPFELDEALLGAEALATILTAIRSRT